MKFPESEMPEEISFESIVEDAIKRGLAALNNDRRKKNRKRKKWLIFTNKMKYPETLLEDTYGNGPYQVTTYKEGKDIPQEIMEARRDNIIEVNKLLMPSYEVQMFFHQKLISNDIFSSANLVSRVSHYDTPSAFVTSEKIDNNLTHTYVNDPSIRVVTNRVIFTLEEFIKAEELVKIDPEIIIAINVYQVIIYEFLQNILEVLQVSPEISDKDKQEFETLITVQWLENSNFIDNIVPALVIALVNEGCETDFSNSADKLLDVEVWKNAISFLIKTGAFKHKVRISSFIAENGKSRDQTFICPAMGKINEQLGDGTLLARVYGIIRKEMHEGNTQIDNLILILNQRLLGSRIVLLREELAKLKNGEM